MGIQSDKLIQCLTLEGGLLKTNMTSGATVVHVVQQAKGSIILMLRRMFIALSVFMLGGRFLCLMHSVQLVVSTLMGAQRPYLVLDLYHCKTETKQLNVAIHYDLVPSIVVTDAWIPGSRRISRNLEARAFSSSKNPDIAIDNFQTSLLSSGDGL